MMCKKYSSQFKIEMVQQYLKEKEADPKTTIAEFASKHSISDSTFNDWVVKYKRQGAGFCNVTDEIKKLDNVEVMNVVDVECKPAMLIERRESMDGPLSVNRVRMEYNGAVIEFDESLLEKAMRILKSW